MNTRELQEPNGVLFQVREKDRLVPVVVSKDNPHVIRAFSGLPEAMHNDLGVNCVAVVNTHVNGMKASIRRLSGAVPLFKNDDSITAHKAVIEIVTMGAFDSLLDECLPQARNQ